jgi:hypothetical protein
MIMNHFQSFDYAMTSNIREMFLQVFVPDKDRDKLRFLLYIDGQLQVYRWNVHLFRKTDRLHGNDGSIHHDSKKQEGIP